MKYSVRLLRWRGINISLKSGYIDPTIEWDGTDNFSLIEVDENVTISKNVLFLTHDYSLNRAMKMKGIQGKYEFKGKITIGKNCFIGARTVLLPNTSIGDNSIVGANAVCKGAYPPNSVIAGNPAKVVTNIETWIDKHISKGDFTKLY